MKKGLGNQKFMKMRLGCVLLLLTAILFSGFWGIESGMIYAKEEEGKKDSEKNEGEMLEPDNLNDKGYDVVYVIDNSGSVWKQQEIRNQAFRNISNLAVGADIRVGVVYFADHVYDTLSLTSMEDKAGSEKVLKFLDMKQQDQGNIDTNIGNALEAAANMFDSQDSSRERIIVLFSDGINENLAGDSAYKVAADRKTEEQAARLKKMKAKIYCVYLQKDRNDEAYLQRLVNYFSDEWDYVPSRFSKVMDSEISTLSDKFAAIYFAMQNNMKYREVNPDSSGNVNFYIPSLGVEKLQVYLDGNIQKSGLASVKDSQYTMWKDKTATFIEYGKPKAGDCTIEIESPDLDGVSGTIACYAYLQVSVDINKKEKGKGEKGKKYEMVVHFYDRNGEEVKIDSMASVEATVIMVDEKGEETEITPAMEIEEGIAKSDAFVLDAYGAYRYELHLTYEDFIDLSYKAEAGSVEKTAPVVHNIEDGKFKGEKTEDGKIAFSIKESELYEDLEGEGISIENVAQLNEANKVSVTQEDGYVNVVADDTGDVNFALQIVDESGMGAEVTVQGNLSDKGVARMVVKIVIVAVLMIILLFILSGLRIRRKKEQLGEMFSEFERIASEFTKMINVCDEEKEKFQENESRVRRALHGEGKKMGVLEFAGLLEEEQREDFGLDVYQRENYEEDILAEGKKIQKEIENAKRGIGIYKGKEESIKKNQGNVDNAIKEIRECCGRASEELDKVKNGYRMLREQNEKLIGKIRKMGIEAGTVEDMLENEIVCKLSIREITTLPNVMGQKGCRNDAGKYIKGFYKLDDVKILGKGKLGDNIGKTGIYIYGYEDEDGSVGLELRSMREFRFGLQRAGNGTDMELKKEAVLLSGNRYSVKIQVNRWEVGMILEVEAQ